MPQHLYAETLLAPGLGVSFQWRFQACGLHLLDAIDRESPVHGALRRAIERFEGTVFELAPDKPTLIEWANSQDTVQDQADLRELRLGSAHVFQQSIELYQGLQMMTDRAQEPLRLAAIHHVIGDVMGFIGQRSGSAHYLEQAAMSYEQALELRTRDLAPREWAQTTCNLGLVMLTLGTLQDDAAMLKQSLQTFKEAVGSLPREEVPGDWAAAMCSVATLLCLLGTHRRGARTLEQSVVAYRNALAERTPDRDLPAWIITQNNLAATMQALGEHEEDIASLEASLPLYDAVLKVLDDGASPLPLVRALIAANRAAAMAALAAESDHLEMAEAAVVEFERLAALFGQTDYARLLAAARARVDASRELVDRLHV